MRSWWRGLWRPKATIPLEWMGARIRVRIGEGQPIIDVPIVGLASFAAAGDGWFDLVGPPGELYVVADARRPAANVLRIEVRGG